MELKVCNLAGQLINTLVDRQQKAGSHMVEWDGRNDEGKSVKAEINFTLKNNRLTDCENQGPHHFGAATPIK